MKLGDLMIKVKFKNKPLNHVTGPSIIDTIASLNATNEFFGCGSGIIAVYAQ